MNRDHDEPSDPDQQTRDRMLIRLLQEHYPTFGMYAWHGYQQFGRGALILDMDTPTLRCRYFPLERGHATEEHPNLVSLIETYNPQTSIVITALRTNLGFIWHSEPAPPACAAFFRLALHLLHHRN